MGNFEFFSTFFQSNPIRTGNTTDEVLLQEVFHEKNCSIPFGGYDLP